jgi:hypothetical protein
MGPGNLPLPASFNLYKYKQKTTCEDVDKNKTYHGRDPYARG